MAVRIGLKKLWSQPTQRAWDFQSGGQVGGTLPHGQTRLQLRPVNGWSSSFGRNCAEAPFLWILWNVNREVATLTTYNRFGQSVRSRNLLEFLFPQLEHINCGYQISRARLIFYFFSRRTYITIRQFSTIARKHLCEAIAVLFETVDWKRHRPSCLAIRKPTLQRSSCESWTTID